MLIRISKYLIPYIILMVIVSFKSKILIGFIIIFIHELIHLITARTLGYSGFSIHLIPIGTSLMLKELDEADPKEDIIISISGPVGNFIIALICLCLKTLLGYQWMKEFATYNIVIGIFNLIPAFPLDGGRILRAILNLKYIYKKANRIALNISIVIGYIFGTIFFVDLFRGNRNFDLLFLSGFILWVSYREKRRIAYIIMGYIVKKREKLIGRGYLENRSISVYYKLNLLQLIELVDKNKYNEFIILDDSMNVIGILYEEDVIKILKELGNITVREAIELKQEVH